MNIRTSTRVVSTDANYSALEVRLGQEEEYEVRWDPDYEQTLVRMEGQLSILTQSSSRMVATRTLVCVIESDGHPYTALNSTEEPLVFLHVKVKVPLRTQQKTALMRIMSKQMSPQVFS